MGKVIRMSETVGELHKVPGTKWMYEDEAGNRIASQAANPKEGSKGNPRVFKDEDAYMNKFAEYCEYVKSNGFINPNTDKPELPTKSNFAKYAGIDVRTVYNYGYKYFPETKKEWQIILADTLTEGAISGVYDKTMTIFCLKNWCDWADKTDNKVEQKKVSVASPEEAREALKKYASK